MVRYLTLRGRKATGVPKETHQKKQEKLAEGQDRQLGRKIEKSVTTMDDKVTTLDSATIVIGTKTSGQGRTQRGTFSR